MPRKKGERQDISREEDSRSQPLDLEEKNGGQSIHNWQRRHRTNEKLGRKGTGDGIQ